MQHISITESAIISCNTSFRDSIDAQTLIGILSGQISAGEWLYHIDTFFNELPPRYILGVINENGLSLKQVADVYYSLPPVFQGRNFKELLTQ